MAEEMFIGEVLRSEFYDIDSVSHDIIRERLKTLLDYYGYTDILLPVFTCAMELAVNAVKANLKNIYFENYVPQTKTGRVSALSYKKALELFRYEIRDNGSAHLVQIAESKNIRSTLVIEMNHERVLTIKVTNPHSMTNVEAENVRQRLHAAKNISVMSDFFEQNEDEMLYEGAGLGIVFVGLVMRRLNLPDDTFEIISGKNDTLARINIPLIPSVLSAYRNIIANNE
jgi:hypothetical protein